MKSPHDTRRCLLIAMPQLVDPNFHQTTSLLSEFNEDGAMGIVLNRPLQISLEKIVGDQFPADLAATVPVYWGGPVQNERAWVLHESLHLAPESFEVDSGLYLSGSKDVLRKLMEGQADPSASRFRFFLGYAGWAPGQLEREMTVSSWVTAPIRRDLVFSDNPESVWRSSLASIGVDPATLAGAEQSTAH